VERRREQLEDPLILDTLHARCATCGLPQALAPRPTQRQKRRHRDPELILSPEGTAVKHSEERSVLETFVLADRRDLVVSGYAREDGSVIV
jgi:hypothetical protein